MIHYEQFLNEVKETLEKIYQIHFIIWIKKDEHC